MFFPLRNFSFSALQAAYQQPAHPKDSLFLRLHNTPVNISAMQKVHGG